MSDMTASSGKANQSKPIVEFPGGEPPATLQIEDLTVGSGDEAVPGGTVEVHYVGVDFETGEEFDSSWSRGESIDFPLRGLIKGWQDGIPGMRVGGRRQLTIPPDQAYGPAGSGHRLAGRTLIFVIDLLDVR
jgi:peptidylprolyl isomerase